MLELSISVITEQHEQSLVLVDKSKDNRTIIKIGDNGDFYGVTNIVESWSYSHNLKGIGNDLASISFPILLNVIYVIVVGSAGSESSDWIKKLTTIQEYIREGKFK